jgi:DNA-binding transcriptional LysR family regulator
MANENFHELASLVAVAEERSFTRAAKKLGVSQSALSQTVRNFESRLGIRLLTRTTRSVAPTEAGERLLRTVVPRFAEINAELAAVSELRDKPAGTVRVTSTENAAEAVLWPALKKILPHYPDIKVEIVIDYGLTDIVTEQVDAGVRPGETVAKDMVAVPIGPDMRMAVVGSPVYLARRPPPRTPQDLTGHDCINLRLPAHRGIYAWEFGKNGRDLRVRVEGQLSHRATGMEPSGKRRTGPGSCQLVPSFPRVSSLLPEPPAALSGIHGAGRRITLPGAIQGGTKILIIGNLRCCRHQDV